jgi:hypothetical protein
LASIDLKGGQPRANLGLDVLKEEDREDEVNLADKKSGITGAELAGKLSGALSRRVKEQKRDIKRGERETSNERTEDANANSLVV